jgi:hypothetical protein
MTFKFTNKGMECTIRPYPSGVVNIEINRTPNKLTN